MTQFNTTAALTLNDLQSLDQLVALLTTAPPEAIFLGFSREDIEALRIDHALEYLNALSDSMLTVHGYADRAFLAISGYDDDPRETYEIPECKTFFRALAPSWGGWFHFLEKQGSSIPNLIYMLLDVEVEHRGVDVTTVRVLNPSQLDDVMPRLIHELNKMYENHAMAESALKKTSLDAFAAFNRAFAPAGSPDHA
ncbi:MAG: hypothetical protein PF483_06460 [Halothiobacillus sp.]|jgi:hypothetical protein|nr:hypothetical protein [Halothiobacillus sp.]